MSTPSTPHVSKILEPKKESKQRIKTAWCSSLHNWANLHHLFMVSKLYQYQYDTPSLLLPGHEGTASTCRRPFWKDVALYLLFWCSYGHTAWFEGFFFFRISAILGAILSSENLGHTPHRCLMWRTRWKVAKQPITNWNPGRIRNDFNSYIFHIPFCI